MKRRVPALVAMQMMLSAACGVQAAGTAATPHPAAAKPRAVAAKPAARKLVLSQPQPTFRGWQELLDLYVHVDAPRAAGFRTSFNYEKFYDDPERVLKAFAVRKEFLRVPPAEMDSVTRRAWGINFYNFMVVELVADHLLRPDKTRVRYKSVQTIRIDGQPVFKVPVVTIDSVTYSLDDFEKHFLFDDYDHKMSTPRPATLDPRVHFAIVGGARGYPALQPRAFVPESLDRQLDRAVRDALAAPHQVAVNETTRELMISSIFQWNPGDFAPSPLAWMLPYVPRAKVAAVRAAMTKGSAWLPWDWDLNQPDNWRFEESMRRPFGR